MGSAIVTDVLGQTPRTENCYEVYLSQMTGSTVAGRATDKLGARAPLLAAMLVLSSSACARTNVLCFQHGDHVPAACGYLVLAW